MTLSRSWFRSMQPMVLRTIARHRYGVGADLAARSPLACWVAFYRRFPQLGGKTRLRLQRIALAPSLEQSGSWGIEYGSTWREADGRLTAEIAIPLLAGVRYLAPDVLTTLLHEGAHLTCASGSHGRIWQRSYQGLVSALLGVAPRKHAEMDLFVRQAVVTELFCAEDRVPEPRVRFRRRATAITQRSP